jgi:hypothetical protein
VLAVSAACLVWLVACSTAAACPFCDGGAAGVNEVRRAVFGPDFWPNVLAAAAPFAVVAVAVLAVHSGPPWGRAAEPLRGRDMTPAPNRRPLIAAGLVLGVGLGGFVDGIEKAQASLPHDSTQAPRPQPETT